MKTDEITTGVDKLMALIEAKKSLSINDAAKELSVPTVVIEEWADFLQQQGVIDIQYKFATPYLVRRELTKQDVGNRTKDFEGRKEAFIRKVQVAIDYIEKESLGLKKVKEEFSNLGQELEEEVKKVRNDLTVLENYETIKRNIDREIVEQQHAFRTQMEEIDSQILERKKSYEQLAEHVKEQELKLDEEIAKTDIIKKNEDILKQRIRKIEKAAETIRRQAEKEGSDVNALQDQIRRMKVFAEKIRAGIESRKNEIEPLIEKSRQHQKKIDQTQQGILEKIDQTKQKISQSVSESRKAKEKFEKFFGEKVGIDVLMDRIDMDLTKLKHELHTLIAEAKLLQLAMPKSMAKHIFELEKRFDRAEKKRSKFEEEIFSLGDLVKGNR